MREDAVALAGDTALDYEDGFRKLRTLYSESEVDTPTLTNLWNQATGYTPEIAETASDFETEVPTTTFEEQGLGKVGTDLPTYLEELNKLMPTTLAAKGAKKGYEAAKGFLFGK